MSGFDSSFHLTKVMCNRLIPTATILPYAGQWTSPQGFLTCNGDVVLISEYQNLYNIIGETYNIGGESSGEFRLPDLRGRAPIGVVPTNVTTFGTLIRAKSLGDASGSETHTLTINEMPSHTHTSNTNAPTLGFVQRTGSNTLVTSDGSAGELDLVNATNLVIDNTGGGAAHNNMQPYLTVNYIIKT